MVDESTALAGGTLTFPNAEHDTRFQDIGANHAEDVVIGILEGAGRAC